MFGQERGPLVLDPGAFRRLSREHQGQDAALRRVALWGDGWYGFNLDSVDAVAERVDFLRRLCSEQGRDPADLRLAVALRELNPGDVPSLAALGIDELVIVEGPPEDARVAADWVGALADRWIARLV